MRESKYFGKTPNFKITRLPFLCLPFHQKMTYLTSQDTLFEGKNLIYS